MVGNPVEHSQSPFIHAAVRARRPAQPIELRARCCARSTASPPRCARFARRAAARGCNVTVPFKFEAVALAAAPHASAPRWRRRANMLRFDADGWLGDNTDGVGLVRDIERNAGVALRGARVLLIGAGGAAAGVLGPLIEARPARGRRGQPHASARRSALVQRHARAGRRARRGLRAQRAGATAARRSTSSINATRQQPAGRGGAGAGQRCCAPGALAVDLMYGAGRAAVPRLGRARTARVARDGLGMLVEQAAEAFFALARRAPETAPVLAALRARLAARP